MRDPNHISNNPQGVDSLWESSLSVANRHSKRLAYLSHTHEPAVGDAIQNTNPECDHFESEGVVVSVNEIPSDAGKTVSYECTNTGDTWQTGDVLEKTLDQLSPSSKRVATRHLSKHIAAHRVKAAIENKEILDFYKRLKRDLDYGTRVETDIGRSVMHLEIESGDRYGGDIYADIYKDGRYVYMTINGGRREYKDPRSAANGINAEMMGYAP